MPISKRGVFFEAMNALTILSRIPIRIMATTDPILLMFRASLLK